MLKIKPKCNDNEYINVFQTFEEALAYCLADKYCKLYRAWEEFYSSIDGETEYDVEQKIIVNDDIFYEIPFGWIIYNKDEMEITYSKITDFAKVPTTEYTWEIGNRSY